MFPNIAEHIHERIRETICEVNVSASYRELMLSVVAEALKKVNTGLMDRIPTAFLPAVLTDGFGGGLEKALNVTSAWFLLQLSAHFLDKVEDQEVDETMTNHEKPGLILNLSTGLIFAAEYLLDHLEEDGVDHQAAADIRAAFHKHILGVCGGQHEDLWFDQPALNLCWQIAKVKSGLFFGLGAFAGARVVTADPHCLSNIWNYGINLGLMKQIADDVESFVEQSHKKSDLATGKWTLPIAYSMEILPEDRATELHDHLKKAPFDSTALRNAREKMIKAGALVYLKLETTKYALEARNWIDTIQQDNFNRKDLAEILAQMAGLEARVLG
jgi:geranylgeranyl pyrophosphate synthase